METVRKLFDFCIFSVKIAGWAPILVFFFHVVAVMGFDAYRHFPLLDIPMHFLGGLVICFFYYKASNVPNADYFFGTHTKFSLFVFLMALTGLTTVLWEFSEWIADTYFGQTAQPSVTDTMADMFLGLLGGFVFCMTILCKSR